MLKLNNNLIAGRSGLGSGGGSGNEHKFLGEGQTFKGKLIGVLEVPDARGDRMCQDAIQVILYVGISRIRIGISFLSGFCW